MFNRISDVKGLRTYSCDIAADSNGKSCAAKGKNVGQVKNRRRPAGLRPRQPQFGSKN
jgi:hypothetical protein